MVYKSKKKGKKGKKQDDEEAKQEQAPTFKGKNPLLNRVVETTKDPLCEKIRITCVDTFKFNPNKIIGRTFDAKDKRRRTWRDADPNQLKILGGAYNGQQLIVFTKNNWYKYSQNVNGKFNQKGV